VTRIAAIIVALFFAALLAACAGGDSATGGDGKVKVVTTLPLFAEFVREVGGDRVEVFSLAPAGADPHTFEPAPRDIRQVEAARIAFGNGLNLEPSTEKIIQANLKGGAGYVKLAETAKEQGAQVMDGNPHLWLDIENAKLYLGIIRDSLTAIDRGGEASYNQSYESYVRKLDEIASYGGSRIASIPAANRKLVTTHDAFPYLARYFGLSVVAFAEQEPGQEPSPDDIAKLTDALKDQNVPAVFTEPQVEGANKTLERAASDAGVQVCTLYSDSLDDRVKSYEDLIRFDADELGRCLGDAGGG